MHKAFVDDSRERGRRRQCQNSSCGKEVMRRKRRGWCAVSLPLKVSGSSDVHGTTMAHFQGGTQERAETQLCKNGGVLVLPGEELQGKMRGMMTALSYRIRVVTLHRSFRGIPELATGSPVAGVGGGWEDKIDRSCCHYPFAITYK